MTNDEIYNHIYDLLYINKNGKRFQLFHAYTVCYSTDSIYIKTHNNTDKNTLINAISTSNKLIILYHLTNRIYITDIDSLKNIKI